MYACIVFFLYIKFQFISGFSNFRTYYFYEFGRDEQRVALVAAVNSGKVCYYVHLSDMITEHYIARVTEIMCYIIKTD